MEGGDEKAECPAEEARALQDVRSEQASEGLQVQDVRDLLQRSQGEDGEELRLRAPRRVQARMRWRGQGVEGWGRSVEQSPAEERHLLRQHEGRRSEGEHALSVAVLPFSAEDRLPSRRSGLTPGRLI